MDNCPELYYTKEHTQDHELSQAAEEIEEIRSLRQELSSKNDNPNFLGLSKDLSVGYYVGVQWLIEDKYALVVEPKVDNLDYLTMFTECLSNPNSCNFVQNIYKINFKQKAIPVEANVFELTPLIIIHFLTLLKKIVQKGLKRDYIWIEENLQSKIKGKLLVTKNFKKNILPKRFDRSMCRYQEYSIDCIENRVLKKTLNFIFNYLKKQGSQHNKTVELCNFVRPAFSSVSDMVSTCEIKSLKPNPMFKEYKETLIIADMMLKRFSYAIHNTENSDTEKLFPPFYIDMPLLFEMYVYTKLVKQFGNDILFKCRGSKRTELDFLQISEQTIIDTKYKECYCKKNGWKKEDIRQLSGYARDIKILKNLNIDLEGTIPHIDCLIIYPDQDNGDYDVLRSKLKETKIEEFVQFYKYGVKLPVKS